MRDPICGMEVKSESPFFLKSGETTFYFCSSRCRTKFADRLNQLPSSSEDICCLPSKPWQESKVYGIILFLAAILVISFFVDWLVPFRETFLMYLRMVGWAIVLGLVLGGIIEHFVPRQYVSQALARPQPKTIFYAVIWGFFMSACCHGILALAIQLYKKGASTSAVIAFLLASPWANLPLTLMLIGFFGIVKGLYIVLAAIVIALTTGIIFQFLERKNWVEQNTNTVDYDVKFSIWTDMQQRIKNYHFSKAQILKDVRGVFRGVVNLAEMILWWICIGLMMASLAGAYVPQHIFHQYMSASFSGLLVTLAVATVIEVCSEGTSPVAFEIFRQTGALGNSFVFLMGGVVTDYTEIGLIWQNIGWRSALWLPLVTVPQVICWGILANKIF